MHICKLDKREANNKVNLTLSKDSRDSSHNLTKCTFCLWQFVKLPHQLFFIIFHCTVSF